jgi:hypothetical protein
MFAARCLSIIDLGTHMDERYGKSKRLIRLVWESSELMSDGRPFTIGQRFTLSLHEKAQLRAMLAGWLGKAFDADAATAAGGFDLSGLLGKAAFINVAHTPDGKYANVKTVNPLPKGMVCPDLVGEPMLYDVNAHDPELFAKLGKKTQEMILASEERSGKQAGAKSGEPVGKFNDSEIPF